MTTFTNWTFSVAGDIGPAGVAIQGTAPTNTDLLWADTSVSGVAVVPLGGTTGQVLAKSSSTDYATAWATPVPFASPAFTGIPTAPTATAGTNTTQLATTAFVTTAVSNISTGAVPNFLVYLSGGNSTAANGATIAYNSEVYDDTNNVVSGVFTVPSGQAGTYSFTAHTNAYNIGTSGFMRGCIVTTGTYANTYFGSSVTASGGVDHYVEVSLVTKLAVGDTVKCLFSVPATGTYSAGFSYNNFSGARIA